jgi:hypothetical protein
MLSRNQLKTQNFGRSFRFTIPYTAKCIEYVKVHYDGPHGGYTTPAYVGIKKLLSALLPNKLRIP